MLKLSIRLFYGARPSARGKRVVMLAIRACLGCLILIRSVSLFAATPSSLGEGSPYSLSLQELMQLTVETAGKFEQAANEAPAIINVISQEEISRFGANSLFEVLDRSTSIAMTGSFFFPQNVASIRGNFESHSDNQVLLLLNGRPMRESFTGGENFSIYTAFPINLIKQIEIIRGPGSVLYGSNAYTGVINIITKDVAEIVGELELSLGSFSTRSIQGVGGYANNGVEISAGFRVFEENGPRIQAFDNTNTFGGFSAGEGNGSFVVNGTYKGLSFNSIFTRSEQDFWGSTSTWAGPVAQSDRTVKSERFMLDLGYQFSFAADRYLDANISYSDADFSYYNYDSASENIFAEAAHHWQISEKLRWLVGATAWRQNVSSKAGLRTAPVPAFKQNWYGMYTQFNYQFSDKLSLIVGAQINKIPKVSANSVPRIGAVYTVNNSSGFKLMHAQAFRGAYGVETNFDLVICCKDDGSNRGGLRGNPELKPETIATTDLQYYRYGENYQFSGTLFYSNQEDLIERKRAADNVVDFLNGGLLDSQGVELEYKYEINQNSRISLSYTYQTNSSDIKESVVLSNGLVVEDNRKVSNVTLQPNRMLKAGYSTSFDNGISIGIYNSWFSEAHDNIILNPNRLNNNPKASAYNLLSANLKIPLPVFSNVFGESAIFEIYGYNLLDEDVYQPEFAGKVINTNPVRAGRSVYFSLTF